MQTVNILKQKFQERFVSTSMTQIHARDPIIQINPNVSNFYHNVLTALAYQEFERRQGRRFVMELDHGSKGILQKHDIENLMYVIIINGPLVLLK